MPRAHSYMRALNETDRVQDVRTPDWIINFIELHIGKMVDVCPLNAPHDCLDRKSYVWPKLAFCNPPYKNIGPFIQRACDERSCRTVCLVPLRTNTPWFLQNVHGRHRVLPISGEVQFKGWVNKLPVPLAFVLIGDFNREFPGHCYVRRPLDACKAIGKVSVNRKKTTHQTAALVFPAGELVFIKV